MKTLIFGLLMLAIVGISGCTWNVDNYKPEASQVKGSMVNITSGNMTYPAYLAAPPGEGTKPAVVLVHSRNGLEPGYRNITDMLASEGYVVLSPAWQTFEQSPGDETVEMLLRDSVAYMRSRPDFNGNIGLTGFCAGGRYTMLFLPQIDEFRSGVAFYGFPYRGSANQSMPADMIEQLKAPLLIIHGTHDQ